MAFLKSLHSLKLSSNKPLQLNRKKTKSVYEYSLNTKSIEAESPPRFAQAAGTPLVYVATTPFNGKGVSFLVPKNSP